MQQTHRERGTRAQAGPRREVPVMVDFHSISNPKKAQNLSNRRVLNLPQVPDEFDLRPYNPAFMLKEGRQIPTADIAILVNGYGQNRTTVLAEPYGIVSPSTKKRYAKRCSTNDHVEK